MKTILTLCLFGVVLCSSNLAQAVDWQVVYQTDFSSDPGWIISPGSNFGWDPGGQRYHIQSSDGGNQYAYVLLPVQPISTCKLEYDIEVTHLDWAGDARFGLGDPDMDVFQPSTWYADYWNGDRGNSAILEYHSESSQGRLGDNYAFLFELSTEQNKVVYHNIITYDGTTQTLIWQALRNGTVVFEEQRTGVGNFVGMDRLYSSSIGDNYAPGAMGEAYIDNVVFSIPEPATLLLLGLGGLILRKRRA
jgi:hypothetical protein